MTTQTGPVIPPRPSRSPLEKGASTDLPKVPPRPSRSIERSVSPLSANYAPSPLNDLPNSSNLSRTVSNDLPPRPPSVTIPSLGEEGIEYADLDVGNTSDSYLQAPAETRNVSSDLKLHAPRPSLPSSSAKAKVQAVTRTDSSQAAAAGFGAIGAPAQDERPTRPLYSSQGGSRTASSTASNDRRRSMHEEEHGIPEIGQRVPMYPNAGDVQAPSPSPYLEQPSQRSGRSHNRTKSGREASLPPGSYGLHGHGVQSTDKFEKAWYEKHPDEYQKEGHGHYGSGVGTPRPDWALSSDDLNKIVRGSAVTGSGLGTSPAVTGTPEEEVGYIASDQYTHRLSTPSPDARRDSRPIIESPLRTEEDKTADEDPQQPEGSGVIHINEPYHHLHHPDGFAQAPEPEELVHGGGDNDEDEPILAADEVRPESAFQHPAVSPTFSRRGSSEFEGRSRTPSGNHSRSNSRSTSQQGAPTLVRYNSREEREDTHTPLEDVEEYEPLFPEDNANESKPASNDRFRQRPELKHRFPSQDIWEDSPNSLQLHATVSTPDIPKHERFETPEQEEYRRSHTSGLDAHKIASQILSSEESVEQPTRPEIVKQRFPSRDIWEDAPESQTLVTTIEPADDQVKSPDVPSKPSIPTRPQKKQAPPVDASTKPSSPVDKRQPPSIPERPKPQIPARPAKPAFRASGDESHDATAKSKPIVPARPGGNKIASLKAGFLSDLNSRLQLGPHAPPPKPQKKEEAPAEKGPLSDARKGRARGPARRKPATENADARLPTIPEIKITETWNVWQVREDGNLVVGNGDKGDQVSTIVVATTSTWDENPVAPPLARNISGDSVDPQRWHKESSEPSSPAKATEALDTTVKLDDVPQPAVAAATE